MQQQHYHPRPIHCPKKMREMNAENTVWNGLNMDTRTGPLRPMLDTWNVVHRPITTPPCRIRSFRQLSIAMVTSLTENLF